MYNVKNLTAGTESTCDAIETIRWTGEKYAPTEHSKADGFRALVIDGDQYNETQYVFEAHAMRGTEPVGAFEEVELPPEPEPEPEPPPEPLNELEQLRVEVAALQASTAPVMAAARAYALTAVDVPDTQALEMSTLFPAWEDVLEAGAELAKGRIISKDGQLYRVMQAVTPQAHQPPDAEGMLAVYRPIDKAHDGTLGDPIPWVYGMDCHDALYYSYNGAIYLCKGDMAPCVWPPDTAMWQWEAV